MGCWVGCWAGGSTALLLGGDSVVVLGDVVVVVVVVLVGDVVLVLGTWLVPWSPPSSCVMPKTINAIRIRTSKAHPSSMTGLRYHAVGSDSSSNGSTD